MDGSCSSSLLMAASPRSAALRRGGSGTRDACRPEYAISPSRQARRKTPLIAGDEPTRSLAQSPCNSFLAERPRCLGRRDPRVGICAVAWSIPPSAKSAPSRHPIRGVALSLAIGIILRARCGWWPLSLGQHLGRYFLVQVTAHHRPCQYGVQQLRGDLQDAVERGGGNLWRDHASQPCVLDDPSIHFCRVEANDPPMRTCGIRLCAHNVVLSQVYLVAIAATLTLSYCLSLPSGHAPFEPTRSRRLSVRFRSFRWNDRRAVARSRITAGVLSGL